VERLAFVLHDMFAVPFDEIARIVDRTPAATRQIASRARRRVQGAAPIQEVDLARQREVVDAFLAASRAGDFDALVAVLDPDVVFRADGRPAITGAAAAARQVIARGTRFAPLARPALVNGAAGAVVGRIDRPIAVVGFTVSGDRIVEIDLFTSREKLGRLTVLGRRRDPRPPRGDL
jgi:RNA polymerase sigma-70 factor (ECF subfamily)